MQADRADRGVFERIVNQSHQHLAQPRGVSNDMAWAACADVDAAGETLVVCVRLQVRRHVVDQSVQVERYGIGLERPVSRREKSSTSLSALSRLRED